MKTRHETQDQSNLKWLADFIWNIADDRLRDVYVRGKYRDVILPFTVLRRLDAVLESSKHSVLERKKFLDMHKIAEQEGALRMAAGQAFYNTSDFTLGTLVSSGQGQRLRDNFINYLDGFSPNVQDILAKFKFRDQIQTMVEADILGHLINDFLDPEVNLSPLPVKDSDGRIKLPALDNHGMGTVFEELIRRFNEENNEEAGEHFTPRDVVKLMAKLLFIPVADQIHSGTYLLYDGSCGTGGMLTVPAPKEEDLSKGVLEAIDMDSYRVEAQASLKMSMDDTDAFIEPPPPGGGGGGGSPEIDKLSNIIRAFNDMFGNIEWKDGDKIRKVITEEIPARVAQDKAYQNAQANSDKQNSKLEHDKALNRVVLELISDHTELFKQFSDNPSFKRWLTDTVFDSTYHPGLKSTPANPHGIGARN